MTSDEKPTDSHASKVITALLALAILIPSLWGFGSKFREFVLLVRGDVQDGIFAVTPVVNYLLASLGFICLFAWAAIGGMFYDIERPKRTMLETEEKLDQSADYAHIKTFRTKESTA